ncbi:type II toxin-antitoxin system HigB family toxin [Anabaena sp. WFMT]|uniref:type II toxin-antitoxin system HigB family toxin n=1 Tax=Anabaena sp. WFMT TaxID=3449730 RepID=UPI003F26C5AD
MHIISRKALAEFSKIHADAEAPLDAWYRIAKSQSWQNIMDVKKVRPDADFANGYTIFDIKHNDYRLTTEINYNSQTIFIRLIETHAEYSKGT